MQTLKLLKAKSYNHKTEQYGFTARVKANGKISAERISSEACENTTLHPTNRSGTSANPITKKATTCYGRSVKRSTLPKTVKPSKPNTWHGRPPTPTSPTR